MHPDKRAAFFKRTDWPLFIFALVMAVSFLAGCDQFSPTSAGNDAATNNGSNNLDATLSVLYDHMGGEAVLGPVISDMFIADGKKYQYTMNCLMVYDGSLPATEYYSLAPLGKRIGISEPPVPDPKQPDLIYRNGYIIDPDFVAFFDESTAIFTGKPLTGVLYNPALQRYEQYFENLGFYKMKGTGQVGLLAYGSFYCKQNCVPADAGAGEISYRYKVEPVFAPFLQKYGWSFTGFPLGEKYMLDGRWAQVFQNVVLTAAALDQPESVRLLRIPEALHINPEAPRPQSGAPELYFYAVDGEKGFEIPNYFWDYLVAHGGLDVSGAPISHLETVSGETTDQCFENLCLVYDPSAPYNVRVNPESLGINYNALFGYATAQITPQAGESRSDEQISPLTLRVKESQPTIPANQQQVIEVSVSRDGFPVPGVGLEISLSLPDGSSQVYVLPPTGSDGKSVQTLPIIQADNGSVILYKICITGQGQMNFCYEDSFTIWSQP